jgi:hypothetical protein
VTLLAPGAPMRSMPRMAGADLVGRLGSECRATRTSGGGVTLGHVLTCSPTRHNAAIFV